MQTTNRTIQTVCGLALVYAPSGARKGFSIMFEHEVEYLGSRSEIREGYRQAEVDHFDMLMAWIKAQRVTPSRPWNIFYADSTCRGTAWTGCTV